MRRLKAYSLQFCGALIIGICFVGMSTTQMLNLGPSFVIIFTCFLILPLGWAIARHGQRLAVADAERALAQDHRRPTILLRSFADDERLDLRPGIFSLRTIGEGKMTLEEVIVREFSRVGPVIAIGRPDETLPPVGAARLYVPDDVWTDEVRERIRDARLVAVVLGSTAGLRREVEIVSETDSLGKTVFIAPPRDDSSSARRHEWRDRMQESEELLGVDLGFSSVGKRKPPLCLVRNDDERWLIVEGHDFKPRSYRSALRRAISLVETDCEAPLP